MMKRIYRLGISDTPVRAAMRRLVAWADYAAPKIAAAARRRLRSAACVDVGEERVDE